MIKLSGALLLLFSITLPMGKCSYYVDSDGNRYHSAGKVTQKKDGIEREYELWYQKGDTKTTFLETLPDDVVKKWSKLYAYKSFELQDFRYWVIIFAFTWPVLALGCLQWKQHGWTSLITRVLEPLLIFGSGLSVQLLAAFFREPDIGAYVAFMSLGIYGVGALSNDLLTFRVWNKARNTNHDFSTG